MIGGRGVFVTGTDTGVGKTYIGAAVIPPLISRGIRVVPRKPVESGCRREGQEIIPTDAAALHAVAGRPGSLAEVCPYRFWQPLSPARAARLEKMHLAIADLERAVRQGMDDDSFLWVEGAGGFYSPLASDGLNADLAERLGLPVLLVAADRLGCINHVLLTVEAVRARALRLVAIVVNQTVPTNEPAMDNAGDLRRLLNCPLFNLGHHPMNPSAHRRLDPLVALLV